MSDLLSVAAVILVNLLIASIIAYLLGMGLSAIKGELIAGTFAGASSYLACSLCCPTCSLACLASGVISAFYTAVFTSYFGGK